MVQTTKEDVLDFVADLAGPIGPEVFAGFGSETQQQLAEDPTCADKLIEDWLNKVSHVDLEPLLIGIASGVDIPDRYKGIHHKFEDRWTHILTTLIYEAFSSDEAKLGNIVSKLEEIETAKRIVSDLKQWLNEEDRA